MKEDNLYERYNRQIILPGFGSEAQLKLQNAKVLVAGAGGLGCPALQYLAAAGVGTLGIADHDAVTLSNLHRQVLFNTDDIGWGKAEVAAAKLTRVNKDVSLHVHSQKLEKENTLQVLEGYDLVIDATDNFPTRYMLADACLLLKKPLVWGAISQYEGQVALFNVGRDGKAGAHYRHLFPEPPKGGEVMNCAEGGVLGPLAGIIGTMQAAEAIKLLTGIGRPLINQLLNYDLRTHETYTVEIAGDGDIAAPKSIPQFLGMEYEAACAVDHEDVEEIDVARFHLLRQDPDALVIDVREEGEKPAVTSIEHHQIPMSRFPQQLAAIEAPTILLFCQHGVRSVYAAELVQQHFGAAKSVYSLKGGIAKWGADLGAATASSVP